MATPRQLPLPFTSSCHYHGGTATLLRCDPAANMARFYSLDVERDLFGRVVLVRRWGRIGTAGKVRLDEYPAETAALAAMQALQARKVRRGYRT